MTDLMDPVERRRLETEQSKAFSPVTEEIAQFRRALTRDEKAASAARMSKLLAEARTKVIAIRQQLEAMR